jgi:hypothetical protein
MERTSRVLSLRRPPRRNVTSLTNWLNGTAALARDETAYLSNTNDLVSLSPPGDRLVTNIESLAEDGLIRFHKGFRSVSHAPLLEAACFYTKTRRYVAARAPPIERLTCLSVHRCPCQTSFTRRHVRISDLDLDDADHRLLFRAERTTSLGPDTNRDYDVADDNCDPLLPKNS